MRDILAFLTSMDLDVFLAMAHLEMVPHIFGFFKNHLTDITKICDVTVPSIDHGFPYYGMISKQNED